MFVFVLNASREFCIRHTIVIGLIDGGSLAGGEPPVLPAIVPAWDGSAVGALIRVDMGELRKGSVRGDGSISGILVRWIGREKTDEKRNRGSAAGTAESVDCVDRVA